MLCVNTAEFVLVDSKNYQPGFSLEDFKTWETKLLIILCSIIILLLGVSLLNLTYCKLHNLQ